MVAPLSSATESTSPELLEMREYTLKPEGIKPFMALTNDMASLRSQLLPFLGCAPVYVCQNAPTDVFPQHVFLRHRRHAQPCGAFLQLFGACPSLTHPPLTHPPFSRSKPATQPARPLLPTARGKLITSTTHAPTLPTKRPPCGSQHCPSCTLPASCQPGSLPPPPDPPRAPPRSCTSFARMSSPMGGVRCHPGWMPWLMACPASWRRPTRQRPPCSCLPGTATQVQ